MSGKLLYELPKKAEELAEIIRTIPSQWCWFDGTLLAPKKLYSTGKVARNTMLLLSRFYLTKPTICGGDDLPFEDAYAIRLQSGFVRQKKDEVFIPQFLELIKGKSFSSVLFDEAGFESKKLSFATVKELLEAFVLRGYKGSIHAFSGYDNNNKYDNPERLFLTHFATKGETMAEPVPLPPHITLRWSEAHYGRREHLDELVAVIERLGMEKLQIA